MNNIKKTLYIKGMHCASCEMLIKQGAQKIDGVKVDSISANTGKMSIEIPNEDILPQIEKAIKDLGYQVLKDKPETTKKEINRKHILQSVVIVGILAFLFYKLNVIQYLPSVGDKLSLGVALLMGIIASVSTCLAIVGSIVIGFSEFGDKETGTKNHLKTQLSFQAGRIGGFFLLGGLLGLIGQVMAISLTTTTILTIFVGIVVLWMGLHLLGLAPNITSMGLHLPKKRSEKTLTTKNPIFAPLIGALTFFLPCGFTLSMQLIAIKTGNFRLGGLAMAIFALGTAPVLLAVGLGSSYIKEKKALLDTLQLSRTTILANMKTFQANLLQKSVQYFIIKITPYKIQLQKSLVKIQALSGVATPSLNAYALLLRSQVATLELFSKITTQAQLTDLLARYVYLKKEIEGKSE